MKKRNVVFLIFMLAIGFAGLATTLVINGNANLSFNDADFISNVVFTKAETADGIATINGNDQNINFETKKLSLVGDTAVLDYEVTNKSRQYNTTVTINCGLKERFTSFNDYLEITNDINSPFELEAGKTKLGKLTLKLKEAYEEDAAIDIQCTLIASPVSRDTLGDKYYVLYKDSTLNGTDPVLDNEGKLVPITIADDGTVTYADIESEWYNYQNKEWANAVILVDSPSQTYNANDIIKENDIESYFVWIPRFRYQIFDEGNYSTYINSTPPPESNAKEIQIEFENKDTAVSKGTIKGTWLTHPAFINYDTNGIWVGKFETGYKGATSVSSSEQNVNDVSKIIIKPNVYSWRSVAVSNIFKMALAYEEGMTSHMMRNTEWGAVAYLSHSKYGINDEVRINNNSSYLTGYSANSVNASESTTNTSRYNTTIGYRASTTGNISGVYDMSGGAWEYLAGYRENTPGLSGFSSANLIAEENAKHFDVYNANSSVNSYNYRILGDATGELGPFYPSGVWDINNWYSDYSVFPDSTYPWFVRGGGNSDGSGAGQFNYGRNTGETLNVVTFRIVLAFEK